MKTKKDLANQIAEKYNLTKKDANLIVNDIFGDIATDLNKDGKVQLFGFGTFTVEVKPEKTWVSPQTREVRTLPKKRVVRFKPAKALKELVDF